MPRLSIPATFSLPLGGDSSFKEAVIRRDAEHAAILNHYASVLAMDDYGALTAAAPSSGGHILNGVQAIKFLATQTASSDVNTLDDYEEGTWTPVDSSGASLTFTNNDGVYTKIGKMVHVQCRFTYPNTANGSTNVVGGLPFTSSSSTGRSTGDPFTGETTARVVLVGVNATTFLICDSVGNSLTNATLSLDQIIVSFAYEASA